MPHVFEELFAASGSRLSDHLTLRPLEPASRHLFPDGSRLDLFNERERSATSSPTSDCARCSVATHLQRLVTHACSGSAGGDPPREAGQRRAPFDPTVYLCPGDRVPGAAPARGPERHLLLANAPALAVAGEADRIDSAHAAGARGEPSIDWNHEAPRCRTQMLETLERNHLRLVPTAERLVTPAEMGHLFPSSRGAIYGASSNSRTAARDLGLPRSPGAAATPGGT